MSGYFGTDIQISFLPLHLSRDSVYICIYATNSVMSGFGASDGVLQISEAPCQLYPSFSLLLGRTATVEKTLFTSPVFCYFSNASGSHLPNFHFTYLFLNYSVYVGVTL